MARTPKLKVYRTAIGFHDAYVAAPSQKAALAAWGSDKDLFGRGAAELVDDPALTQAPLAAPGTVVKRLRGTAEEQLAALPPDTPKSAGTKQAEAPARKRPPRPSRAELDAAERALAEVEERQDAALQDLADREARLRRERKELEAKQARERDRASRALDEAQGRYERALKAW